MVLDKLGSKFKDVLNKVAKSMFVDDKLINELIREIQRALLSADVNVTLVSELTKSIKEKALTEKTKLDKRTQLVNIVYEELVKFLGDEKSELEINKKKPFKIMMVGVYGSGKCVHPDTNILLSDGNLINAKNIYDKYSDEVQVNYLEDGEILDLSSSNLYVPSFNPNTFRIEKKKVTNLWKLKGKELLDVYLDNGNDFSVKVTPEHPFFVLRKGEFCKIRADELNEDDFVAVPKNCNLNINKNLDFYNSLKTLDLDVFLNPSLAKKIILNKYNTLKEACSKLKYKRNYCNFVLQVNNQGRIPICLLDNFDFPYFKIKYKNSSNLLYFPRYFTSDFAEFIGYVVGDGGINNKYIQISNENEEIVERIRHLSLSLFGIEPKINRDNRTKNLFDIRINSKTLVVLFEKLFEFTPGKKGKSIRVPKQIFRSSDECVISFLRAYFDCDSYPTPNCRQIELTSESGFLIKDVYHLLLRFGIVSTISKKFVNKIPYWRLSIRSRYAEKYAEKISFRILSKKNKVNYYKAIGIRQGCGKQDMIPVGNLLYDIRNSFGHSLGYLRDKIFSYQLYEKKGIISSEKLFLFYNHLIQNSEENRRLDVLENIANFGFLRNKYSNGLLNPTIYNFIKSGLLISSLGQSSITSKGTAFIQKYKNYNKNKQLSFIKNLSQSDICWSRVSRVEQIEKPDFVYDLTVEDNHSFIADGFIVHNTTTISKLAHYYKKRGYKIGVLGLDIHRPAAIDQIEQLCKKVQVDCYTDRKEKNPIKIYEEFKDKYSKYDILFIDTAGRDSLDKELIKEIKGLNDKIKPDEKLLVLSADIGQAAQELSEGFHKNCGVTGVVISKLDGTARAGGALTGTAATGAKVKFVGVGEKVNDLETFNPKGFVSRLLGMGDLESLLEKAKDVLDEEKAGDMKDRMMSGDFNLDDLYDQMKAMKKMGPLNKIMDMVPGMSGMKLPKDMLKTQEGKLEKWKHAMDSMTKKEKKFPDTLDANRIKRISKGSGVAESDIRELIKQYRTAKKMMKMMKGKDPEKMMKKMGKFKLK